MSEPNINVNIRPKRCECPGRFLASPIHDQEHRKDCPSSPVPIPCPLPNSVTFEVALGECNCTIQSWWTETATTHAAFEVKQGRAWTATSGCACGPCQAARRSGWVPGKHNAQCPARPVKVCCSISGETWEESEVEDAELGDSGLVAGYELLSACRERWVLVKRLVLGQWPTTSAIGVLSEAIPGLVAQRDTVFAALADMARAESAIIQRMADVDKVHTNRSRLAFRSVAVDELTTYIERIIEQVGTIEMHHQESRCAVEQP